MQKTADIKVNTIKTCAKMSIMFPIRRYRLDKYTSTCQCLIDKTITIADLIASDTKTFKVLV